VRARRAESRLRVPVGRSCLCVLRANERGQFIFAIFEITFHPLLQPRTRQQGARGSIGPRSVSRFVRRRAAFSYGWERTCTLIAKVRVPKSLFLRWNAQDLVLARVIRAMSVVRVRASVLYRRRCSSCFVRGGNVSVCSLILQNCYMLQPPASGLFRLRTLTRVPLLLCAVLACISYIPLT
jgi:hypothetical protein